MARVQSVSREQATLLCELLERFREQTGVTVLVNTSFTTPGRPIVCTPQDALECFFTSPIDVLAIGGYVLPK
jgi:carbamoyltransferase